MSSIRKWAMLTFILTFLVIIAGGVVRMTQSGMGCPDWPRCFGKWIPPTHESELPADFEKYLSKQDIDHTFNAYHTWIEYFNRLLGALLGVFAIIQCFIVFSKRKMYPGIWRLAKLFLFTVILTGVFGAIVVKLNLAHLSISVHLLLAIILVQIQLLLVLKSRLQLSTIPVNAGIKKLFVFFLVLLFIQSVLGTMVRMHIDDISKLLNYEQRELWLTDSPAPFLLHRSFSWFIMLFTIFIVWKCIHIQGLKSAGVLLGIIICISMISGITLYYADMPAIAQPLHLLLASLAITQTFSILFRTTTISRS